MVWPDWSSICTNDCYWLYGNCFLPACLQSGTSFLPASLCSWGRAVTAYIWQLLSWLLCDGIISCYLCSIYSGLALYTTLVVSSPHTCDWRLACPLLHPRDVPVRCRRASLQMTHWEEGSWYKYSHHYDNIRIPSEPRFDHDLEMDIISDSNTRPWVWRNSSSSNTSISSNPPPNSSPPLYSKEAIASCQELSWQLWLL